jgi:hypothetical protein
MAFHSDCYDAKTAALMTLALDAAWDEVEFALTADRRAGQALMALRIMAAVRDGERDPERLKEWALGEIAKFK